MSGFSGDGGEDCSWEQGPASLASAPGPGWVVSARRGEENGADLRCINPGIILSTNTTEASEPRSSHCPTPAAGGLAFLQ